MNALVVTYNENLGDKDGKHRKDKYNDPNMRYNLRSNIITLIIIEETHHIKDIKLVVVQKTNAYKKGTKELQTNKILRILQNVPNTMCLP